VRLGLIDRHGLWADELFSLAMASGHSLEHPAAVADPTLGDYVESPGSLPPSGYSSYLRHESPPASPGRVLRAVRLSDTSPPLYYLLLYGWTRAAGTGDAALRLFSVGWALACFPVLWSLARQLGGPAAALPTCALFSLSPPSVFYSTEGRMYSLLWFWTVATLWLALALRPRGFRPGLFALWVAVGAAGLLTHYFYAFVWAASAGWLLLYPGRLPRAALVGGAALTALLVLPWYVLLPESLGGWRVTGDWLRQLPGGYHPVLTPLRLPWSWLSIQGSWGLSNLPEALNVLILPLDVLNLLVFLGLAAVVLKQGARPIFTRRCRLLWLCALGAWLGVVGFDLLRGTHATAISRYALAGLPSTLLLAGVALGRLRPLPRALFLVPILLVYSVGVCAIYLDESRHGEPFRQLGAALAAGAGESDLVIVHSIPSGVTGVARAVERVEAGAPGVVLASWVGGLGQRRVPQDVRALAAGHRRVILLKVHWVGEPAPEEDWLRENARLVDHVRYEMTKVRWLRGGGPAVYPETFVSAEMLTFEPWEGGTFPPAPTADRKDEGSP
jgi:uncharacterized membrane protein